MRRLVESSGFAFVFSLSGFLLLSLPLLLLGRIAIHLGASIRTLVGRAVARCIMVSDDDERALLSKGRPRGPSPAAQSPRRWISDGQCKTQSSDGSHVGVGFRPPQAWFVGEGRVGSAALFATYS